MLDAWHVHHGPGSFDDVASVPGEAITGIQLCDVPASEPEDYGYATRFRRLLPGRGAADLAGLLRGLAANDCSTPLSLEVFDTERVQQVGAVAFAREMGEATRALLASAG